MGGCMLFDLLVFVLVFVIFVVIVLVCELVSNDDEVVYCLIEDVVMFMVGDGGEDQVVWVVVLVVLDYVGEVLIGQFFSELQGEVQWYLVGLGELIVGCCEYYECGMLFEGVVMMVQDGDVVCFDLVFIDDFGQVVLQLGLFGFYLGMLCVQVFQQLFKGVFM